jgi:hypothetical protein
LESNVVLKRPKPWKHGLRTCGSVAPLFDPSSGLGGEEKKREKRAGISYDDIVVTYADIVVVTCDDIVVGYDD